MKKILLAVLALIGIVGGVFAEEQDMHMGHPHDMSLIDMRISLGVTGEMRQHQLSNMREHVEAIKSIVGLMADNKFEEASNIAHTKLGLTPEMRMMCGMFNNKNFEALGLAFHQSGDELGNTLKTKDVTASLRALSDVMQYCVACHATYRQ